MVWEFRSIKFAVWLYLLSCIFGGRNEKQSFIFIYINKFIRCWTSPLEVKILEVISANALAHSLKVSPKFFLSAIAPPRVKAEIRRFAKDASKRILGPIALFRTFYMMNKLTKTMKAVKGWLEYSFSAFLYIFYKKGAFSSSDFLDEKEISKCFVMPEKELKILEVIIPFPRRTILAWFFLKNSYSSEGDEIHCTTCL